jgi:S-adenosylmethionine:tRNA ribosyltransferase-isomerase
MAMESGFASGVPFEWLVRERITKRFSPTSIQELRYSFMKVADFDFYLPKGLIAERPLKDRGRSRLLVLHRDGIIEHKRFTDLPAYLGPGDMLLINNTRVFPARLAGSRETGAKLEIVLVRERENGVWEVLSKGNYSGTLKISEKFRAVLQNGEAAHFEYSGDFMDLIREYGSMPLPPYIKRLPDALDKETYQTVYSKEEGSIAAPTAGLHFTKRLLEEIVSRGVVLRELTLHVGVGTFRPIRSEDIEDHYMEPEYFLIEKDLISEIERAKTGGKRIVAVGTTTTRAIEGYLSNQWSAVKEKESRSQGVKESSEKINHSFEPSNPRTLKSFQSLACQNNNSVRGSTDIFIYPGYEFRAVTSLVTNFHLPKSTPLMLVSALCGLEKLKESYERAVTAKYRFFSYGDAMLIL